MSYLFPYGVVVTVFVVVACLVHFIVRVFERRFERRAVERAHVRERFAMLAPECRRDIRALLTTGYDGRLAPRDISLLAAAFWLEGLGLAKRDNSEWTQSGWSLTRRGRVFAKDVARWEER